MLEDVGQAVMLNVYDQGGSASAEERRMRSGVGVTRFANIRIINVSGTVLSPGKILCDASAACDGIVMSNIQLEGLTKNSSYTCSNAFGTSTGCSPRPCLKTEQQQSSSELKTDDSAAMGLLVLTLSAVRPRLASSLDNGLGLRGPPLGWSSWNHFHGNINASIIKEVAAAMATNGLRDAGYKV
eukprot:SAG22_NODE_447_length_10412_cov_7.930088_3_plen_184_part_00